MATQKQAQAKADMAVAASLLAICHTLTGVRRRQGSKTDKPGDIKDALKDTFGINAETFLAAAERSRAAQRAETAAAMAKSRKAKKKNGK